MSRSVRVSLNFVLTFSDNATLTVGLVPVTALQTRVAQAIVSKDCFVEPGGSSRYEKVAKVNGRWKTHQSTPRLPERIQIRAAKPEKPAAKSLPKAVEKAFKNAKPVPKTPAKPTKRKPAKKR